MMWQKMQTDTASIDALLARSEEYGECLIWTGTVSNNGHAIYKPTGGACTLVRRAVYKMNGGYLAPRQPIDCRCGEKLCINPDHLFASSIAKIAQKAAALGSFSRPIRCAKIAASKQKAGKITMEQAKEIRGSSEVGHVLADRYGIDKSLVNKIKKGTAWKEYGNNPFAGLGQRVSQQR
jgi:hypothetical protein